MRGAIAIAALLGGCGATSMPVVRAIPPAPPALTPPGLRLPDGVRPLRYALDVEVDPSAAMLRGTVMIEVELAAATQVVWLSTRDLVVPSAEWIDARGILPLAPDVVIDPEKVALLATRTFGPGRGVLRVAFRAPQVHVGRKGPFRRGFEGRAYSFTQFEPDWARRAFPCFDEPGWKTPWRVALTVPTNMVAASNAPIEREETTRLGWRHVFFRETPPLPTYLVAWAVGPFDVLELGRAGRRGVPMRVLVPRGHAADARELTQDTPKLLEWIEDYADVDYPFAKLDQVLVPRFDSAMENPGLVTYDLRTTNDAYTWAHELAHQWFGDLVTSRWWNEIWLNESLANFIADRVAAAVIPDAANILRRSNLMELSGATGPTSSAALRPVIRDEEDLVAAFSPAVYSKGRLVLATFERWLGPIAFRRALHAYLLANAWRSVELPEFVAPFERLTGRAVDAPLRSFLDQPGQPMVTAQLTCGARPEIALAQSEALDPGDEPSDRRWQIPVCARWGAGDAVGLDCTLLDAKTGSIALKTDRCPDWFSLGPSGQRYYHVNVPLPALVRAFASDSKLPVFEREALAVDLLPMIASGRLHAADAIDLLPHVTQSLGADSPWALGLAKFLGERYVDDRSAAGWAALLRRCFSTVFDRSLPWPANDRLAFIRGAWLNTPSPQAREWSEYLFRWLRLPETQYFWLTEEVQLALRHAGDPLIDELLRAARSFTGDDRRLLTAMLALVAPPGRARVLGLLAADAPLSAAEQVDLLTAIVRDASGAAEVRRLLEAHPPPALSSAQRDALLARALRVERAFERAVTDVHLALATAP